tara:strand:+ start:293 stop:484 length:192 start_codon:yes stop_codon:yes gene_type:complete
MATTLVIFLFSTIVFFLFFILSSSKSNLTVEENNYDDLDEWICKSCGFNVQLGTECIYCGRKK